MLNSSSTGFYYKEIKKCVSVISCFIKKIKHDNYYHYVMISSSGIEYNRYNYYIKIPAYSIYNNDTLLIYVEIEKLKRILSKCNKKSVIIFHEFKNNEIEDKKILQKNGMDSDFLNDKNKISKQYIHIESFIINNEQYEKNTEQNLFYSVSIFDKI